MSNQDEQYNALTDDIREIAKGLQAIYSQVESTYVSAVDDIISRRSKETKEIELLLDYMLGFVDDERILASYRKLCRYYRGINPQATAEYIKFYKEMYDVDEKLFKSGYFRDRPISK